MLGGWEVFDKYPEECKEVLGEDRYLAGKNTPEAYRMDDNAFKERLVFCGLLWLVKYQDKVYIGHDPLKWIILAVRKVMVDEMSVINNY